MKVAIKEGTVNIEELKNKLIAQFPQYQFKNQMGLLMCFKTSAVGAAIMVRKNNVVVNGNFPSVGGRMLFMLCLLLLGVLIPLIIYFATFHKKMKNLEKELCGFIQKEYGGLQV